MKPALRYAVLAAALLPLAACELAEVTAANSENLVVVEGILRAGEAQQRVLLHRPLGTGDSVTVPGAQVEISAPGGRRMALQEAPLRTCLAGDSAAPLPARASCYTAAASGGFVRPGETYELNVRTPDGERIRGRTRVPGSFALVTPRLAAGTENEVCSLPPNTLLPLVWTAATDAWVYVADVRIFGLKRALQGSGIEDIPEPLQLTGLAISREDTTLVLPEEIGIFERREYGGALLLALRSGFPNGVRVELTLSAADRNYVNGVRGGSFNPSGNVRVSSVAGDGIGVFGSVVPRRLEVHVGSQAEAGVAPCLPAPTQRE